MINLTNRKRLTGKEFRAGGVRQHMYVWDVSYCILAKERNAWQGKAMKEMLVPMIDTVAVAWDLVRTGGVLTNCTLTALPGNSKHTGILVMIWYWYPVQLAGDRDDAPRSAHTPVASQRNPSTWSLYWRSIERLDAGESGKVSTAARLSFLSDIKFYL